MSTRALHPTSGILSWHAHIYYDVATTRTVAEWLRARIEERFAVQMGRWHDVPVGPHAQPMYQVAFAPALFDTFVPWLALNRQGLNVLVHPNTLAPHADHLLHALWLGKPLALDGSVLPARIEARQQDAVVVNTAPGVPAAPPTP
jgi:aromatic ring-cleaving dioxygenase